MNKYKKLLSDTALYGLGTFASKLLVFFLTRLYTECLSPAEYSRADLITNMANLLIPLAAAGICDAIFRFALEKNADKRAVLSTGALILLTSSVIFLLLSPLLMIGHFFKGYVILIALYVLMSNFHSMCAQYVRASDRPKLFALQGIINTALTISFNVIFLVVLPDGSLLNGVYGYVLSIVIADFLLGVFLVLYAKLYREIRFSAFEKKLAMSMLKYSVPLIPTTVFWWITNVSDRYMVTFFCGESENGLYTAAYKIPTLLTLMTGVFSEAWQFSAAREDDAKSRSAFYGTVFSCFQGLIFLAGVCIIALCRVFSKILYASDYYEAWRFIPILVISGVFSSFVNFLSSVYMVKKRSVKSFLTSMIGALTNIFLNLLLIPESLTLGSFTLKCVGLGAYGAAIATLASYITVFIIRAIDTRSLLKFDMHIVRFIFNTILIGVSSAAMLTVQSTAVLYTVQALLVVTVFVVNGAALWKGVKSILSK